MQTQCGRYANIYYCDLLNPFRRSSVLSAWNAVSHSCQRTLTIDEFFSNVQGVLAKGPSGGFTMGSSQVCPCQQVMWSHLGESILLLTNLCGRI